MQLQGGPDGYQDILWLGLLLDRWVVCVYGRGDVVMWDGDEVGAEGREERDGSEGRGDGVVAAVWELWGDEPWSSAIAVPNVSGDAIYVAVTRAQNRSQPGYGFVSSTLFCF